tara:strand:- start:833 stop:1699 length:867 start_codon:yes stop_codon:yes gene_type:complete
MAYNQKNSPFKQTKDGSFDFSKSAHEAKYGSDSQPKTEQVTIGKRAKRGLKDAYDIALTKGYRKKSESFADYSKRAKADPLYGKSGSKGYTVKATDGMVDVAPYKDKISVEDLKKKEAKEYATTTKKLNAGASKIRESRKVINEAAKNRPKVAEIKTEQAKINTPKKTTKVTVSRRDQRRLDKQAEREARIAETRKKGKAAAASGDKIAANRLRRKQARIEGRIAKTNKKMSESAGIKTKEGTYNFAEGTGPKTSKFDKTKNAGDKPKTKVKARRRAAKGSTRATLRK